MGRNIIRDKNREKLLKHILKEVKIKELEKRKKMGKEAEIIWRRGEMIGSHLYCYSLAHRTMTLAKEYIERSYLNGRVPYSGTVFIAEMLTEAKGRYQRDWYASLGGLWFTLLLYPEIDPPYIHLYPLVVGIACCEALREIGIKAYIKWVNDLIVDNYKIGGILTETYISSHKEAYLLFGIGINVNNKIHPNLDIPAISVKNVIGRSYNIDFFFCLIIVKLIWYIGLLHDAEIKKDTKEIIKLFTEYSNTVGRIVYYGEDLKKNRGELVEVLDIDSYGGLNIRFCQKGEIATVYTGELKYV